MKTLRKHATMAFLLVSVAIIVSVYANPVLNEHMVKQEEITVEPQKIAIVRNKKSEERETLGVILALTAVALYTSLVVLKVSRGNGKGNPHRK